VNALALQVDPDLIQQSRFGLRSMLALVAAAGFAVYLCYLALRPEPDTIRR